MNDKDIDAMLDGVMHKHKQRPSGDELIYAIQNKGGETKSRAIVRRAYVFDLMCDVIVNNYDKCVNDIFTDKGELRKVFDTLNKKYEKILDAVAEFERRKRSSSLFFGDDDDTPFSFGMRMYGCLLDGVNMFSSTFKARLPSDFPFERCRELIRKYNTNNVMYDPSCGWGSRLCACINEGVDYYGTDPNDKLIPRLQKMGDMTKSVLHSSSCFKLYCQGSEHPIESLVGKCGLILTSPPYFDLEDYRYGEQSIVGRDYGRWKEEFLRPTLQNCYEYLTEDGHAIINIKNTGKYKMFDDTLRLAEEVGFKLKCFETLEVKQRYANNETHSLNNDESCMVLVKSER